MSDIHGTFFRAIYRSHLLKDALLNTNNPLNLDRPHQEQFVFNEIGKDHVFTLTCHRKFDDSSKDSVRDANPAVYRSNRAPQNEPELNQFDANEKGHENPTTKQTDLPIVKEPAGVGSNQYKSKPLPPIDLAELHINKLELKFKAEVLDDLHRKMAMDKLTDPVLLAEKIKLPMREIQALCKADLKKVSSFMMLHGVCQFGYDIYVCLRPTEGYLPGEIFFEG